MGCQLAFSCQESSSWPSIPQDHPKVYLEIFKGPASASSWGVMLTREKELKERLMREEEEVVSSLWMLLGLQLAHPPL